MLIPNPLLHALGRLLSALEQEATRPEAVSAGVRGVTHAAERQGLDVWCDGARVQVDGIALLAADVAGEPVMRAMRRHGIGQLTIRQHARARDIAQLAGILARQNDASGHRSGCVAELDTLRLWSVRLVPAAVARHEAAAAPAVDELLEALRAAPEQHACDAAFEQLIAALKAQRWPSVEARASGVATAITRALAVNPLVHESLRTQTPRTLVAVLADALVSSDAAVRRRAAEAFRATHPWGVEALVAHLAAARTIDRRRRYFDALVAADGAVPTLIDALGHPQWYVVRNVAQILGERGAVEACHALGRVLGHDDPRVRLAAAEALDRIGTHDALAALQTAAGDESADVRRLAARAFAAGIPGAVAPGVSPIDSLVAAFDRERDTDALVEQTRAFGVVATPDAVMRLIDVATGSARPLVVRRTALESLVIACGMAALPTLRALRVDREASIRDAARRLESRIVN